MKSIFLILSLFCLSFLLYPHCQAKSFLPSEERLRDDEILKKQIDVLSGLDEEKIRDHLSHESETDYKEIVPRFETVSAQDFNLKPEWSWYPGAYGFTRFEGKATIKWGHVDLQQQKILTLKLDPLKTHSSKLAVFAHGYLDHLGCSSNFYETLLEAGVSVLAFDLPGHGLSSGRPGHVDDFRVYAEVLAELVSNFESEYAEVILIGFSTGASTIMEAQRLQLLNSKYRKIFISPLVRVAYYWALEPSFKFAYFAYKEWNWSLLDFAVNPRRWVNSNSHDPLFLEFLNKDPLSPLNVPGSWTNAYIAFAERNKAWFEKMSSEDRRKFGDLLILQGDADGVVDAFGNVQFLKAQIPGTKVIWFRDGGHQLLNESFTFEGDILPRVYSSIVQYIQQ